MHRSWWFALVLAALSVALVACDPSESPPASGAASASAPITPASPTASPTPPATPASPPPTIGAASSECVEGWTTPGAETPRFTDPLGIIRRTTGVKGPLAVVDMRYFTGPESPPSDQGYLLEVERWYIKLYSVEDLAFQGRFLVEARRFGRGVSAVAAYDSDGFRSPDWIGFQFDSAHSARMAYPDLPGGWSGIPYDFVMGGEGLKIPGLPDEVRRCLEGT